MFLPLVFQSGYSKTFLLNMLLEDRMLRGCLLDAYPGKRLPMSLTLLIEHDENQKTYPVRDSVRS